MIKSKLFIYSRCLGWWSYFQFLFGLDFSVHFLGYCLIFFADLKQIYGTAVYATESFTGNFLQLFWTGSWKKIESKWISRSRGAPWRKFWNFVEKCILFVQSADRLYNLIPAHLCCFCRCCFSQLVSIGFCLIVDDDAVGFVVVVLFDTAVIVFTAAAAAGAECCCLIPVVVVVVIMLCSVCNLFSSTLYWCSC